MLSTPTLEKFVAGKSDSKNYIKSMYFSTVLMISVSILSQLLFPDNFFFWNHTISSQGSILRNPVGNIFWRSGIIVITLLKFPDVMYIFKKMESMSKDLAKKSKACGLIASVGFFFVGVFPEEIKPFHGISAFVCFTGYFIMINLNLVIIGLELKDKKSPNYRYLVKNRQKIRFLYILINIGFFFMLVSSIFNTFSAFFPLWEWFYLFSLILWFLMFPTFIEHDKEIVVFEIKSSEITKKIRSRVSLMSLLVLSSFIFSLNLQNIPESLFLKNSR